MRVRGLKLAMQPHKPSGIASHPMRVRGLKHETDFGGQVWFSSHPMRAVSYTHLLESGGVIMDDDTRKTVIKAWQERKQEQIMHPFIGEKIEIGLIPYAQAMLLARHLRGDLDGYPPFFWK